MLKCCFVLVSMLLALSPSAVAATPAGDPSAEAIMARVAANQDAAQAERTRYLYTQHAKVTSRKGKTIECEEITDSRVMPTASGSLVRLLKLDGRMLVKHAYVAYTTPHVPQPGDASEAKTERNSLSITLSDENTDRDLVEHMRLSLTDDATKDGIGSQLFPLTSRGQDGYSFKMAGRERMNGRAVFHIEFRPKEKDEYGWKGDAYVDCAVYQPVAVVTDLSRKLPLAVRTLLGTNVPGFGFTITYAPQPDGVWFPATLSTEFKMHVLFFFSREIIIDAENRNFEKTHVNSKIVDADVPIMQP